eukprot:207915-Chlamydomonas_euryale.AAC.3
MRPLRPRQHYIRAFVHIESQQQLRMPWGTGGAPVTSSSAVQYSTSTSYKDTSWPGRGLKETAARLLA